MTAIRCFWLEPVPGKEMVWLRRYAARDVGTCPGPMGYHDDMTLIGVQPKRQRTQILEAGHPARSDERWPKKCVCGYDFAESDTYQVFTRQLYRRTDTGEEMTLRRPPPGAMWDAHWFDSPQYRGPDGRCLVVMTPGGEWMVDARANNCTRKDDHVHKCWVRHGEPPNITVDKDGDTCAAGAGSIAMRDYHGFLRNGFLTPA